MISRIKKKSESEYVILERKPFTTKHLTPTKSSYSRIENVTANSGKYKVVYVKNNRVYRRVFFYNFSYADKAFVAFSKALLGSDEPLWDLAKYVMEDGRPVLRKEGFKRWILRKTSWMHS